MSEHELTCGQELAAGAEVPLAMGALMGHVAANLKQHAAWVGVETPAARKEHDALLLIAMEYENMAAAGQRAAETMHAMAAFEMPPHDPEKLDRTGFEPWMRRKLELQKQLAQMLLSHAAESETELAE